jgi:AcrR family transcriptional regulator
MPKRSSSKPKRTRPRMRREIVLATAGRLFREKGFADTTVGDIAQAVGIVQSALYRHFAGKTELFAHVMLRTQDALERSVAQAYAATLDPAERLELVIRSAIAQHAEQGDIVSQMRQAWSSLPARTQRALLARHARVEKLWVELLRAVRPELGPADAQALVRIIGSVLAASEGAPPTRTALYERVCRAIIHTPMK